MRLNLWGEKNFLPLLPTHRQSEGLCRHPVDKSANSYHHQGDIYLQIDLPLKISVLFSLTRQFGEGDIQPTEILEIEM